MKDLLQTAAFLIIIAFIIAVGYTTQTEHRQILKAIHEQDSVLAARTHLDSLYWEHLERCAFEVRNNYKSKELWD